MKTFAQPKTIASILVEPPVITPAIEVDTSVPMLDLPTMDLPGAPSGGLGAGQSIGLHYITSVSTLILFITHELANDNLKHFIICRIRLTNFT